MITRRPDRAAASAADNGAVDPGTKSDAGAARVVGPKASPLLSVVPSSGWEVPRGDRGGGKRGNGPGSTTTTRAPSS